jgi:hypothetical protein
MRFSWRNINSGFQASSEPIPILNVAFPKGHRDRLHTHHFLQYSAISPTKTIFHDKNFKKS